MVIYKHGRKSSICRKINFCLLPSMSENGFTLNRKYFPAQMAANDLPGKYSALASQKTRSKFFPFGIYRQ